MHELSVTVDMVDAITERMKEYPDLRVKRVVVEIGKMSAVYPDAIRTCFEFCTRETSVAGAELEILEPDGTGMRIKHLEVE